MIHKRAFTLIELLVVIAIIAVLMGILMPALNAAKEQARAVKCQAHLHQWGLIFDMYISDNDGNYYSGAVDNISNAGNGEWWREPLKPYSKEKAMWVCPSAAKNRSAAALTAGVPAADPFDAWRVPESQGGDEGSYTPNGWMCNPERGVTTLWGRGPTRKQWRKTPEKGASEVPVMSEGWWVDAWPEDTDKPSEWGDRTPVDVTSPNVNEMQRVCVNRHNGAENILFADWSTRRVSLKQLWRLKWNREFRTNLTVNWPQWMAGFKDTR